MRATTVLLAFLYASFVGAVCFVAFGDTPVVRLHEILKRAESEDGAASMTALLDLDEWRRKNGDGGVERLRAIRERRSGRVKELIDTVLQDGGPSAHALVLSASNAADAGAPRTELLRCWKRIAALPENWYSALAPKMVSRYQSQILADGRVRPKSTAELAALSPAQRAEYWISLFPDIHCPGDYFGRIDVLQPPQIVGERYYSPKPWPPGALFDLGFDAVPVLIEHLDDFGPTRCTYFLGQWSQEPEILTVGAACAQILSDIAGRNLFDSFPGYAYPTGEEALIQTKQRAKVWWAPKAKLTREDQLLALLDDNPRLAARELMESYGEKHHGPIVEAVKAHPDRTGQLVYELWKRLGPEDADLFRAMRAAKDSWTRLAAAEALARKAGDLSALQDILTGLRTEEKEPSGAGDERIVPEGALRVLCRVNRNQAVDLALEMLRREPGALNPRWLQAIRVLPEPEVLDAAIPWLDQFVTPNGRSGEDFYREWALDSVGEMTGWPGLFGEDRGNTDVRIQKLKAWLKENREKLDWPALRRAQSCELPE